MTTKYETVNQAGVFSKLLKDYPQLEEFLINEYFNTNKLVGKKNKAYVQFTLNSLKNV